MLIKIESVTSGVFANAECAVAIENILRSFAENKHIVIAPKLFFKGIINDNSGLFSSSCKGFAVEALKSQFEYNALIASVSFMVCVDFSKRDNSYEWVSNPPSYKFKCGPFFFNDSSQLQKARIVCENPMDSDFLIIIAKYFAKLKNLEKCHIGFDALNGGGGSTKDIFERTIKKNEITFCIVDNDKMHPKAPHGGTSSHFLRDCINKTGFVKILDVHEIESLIPLSVIEEVLESLNLLTVKQKKDALTFFKDLCSVDESVKFYYDHKNGFALKSAWILDKKHGEYWRKIIAVLNKKYQYQCECVNKDDCKCDPSCLSYEGFGDGLLANSLNYLNRGNLKQFTPVLTPRMKILWEDVGRSFFSWSCGPYKKSRLS